MRPSRSLPVLLALTAVIAIPVAAQPVPTAVPEPVALFDQVWSHFEATYSYFEHKGIDWDAFRERHRPTFEVAMTPDEFAAHLANALGELRDQHVWVMDPNGNYVPVYAPGFERNFTNQPRNRYRVSDYGRLGEAVWYATYVGDIGYVRVDTFESQAFAGIDGAAIARLFDGFASLRGVIIDVRPNAGGDEGVAALFAGHFTDEPRGYGYFQFRQGDGFGPVEPKVLQPFGTTRMSVPTAVLIGDRNMSSAEWFVLMMQSCPQVTLIGDATRGSSGNPVWLDLANGVRVSVPRWIAYRADGEPLEGNGIEPDIAIAPEASFDGSHDYVVERALELLGATTP